MTDIDLQDVCRRYGSAILRRCRGMLGDADEAQDAAQEVFVTILNKGHQFRGDADLGSWIYRLTTNQCLNRLRGDRRRDARAEHGARWYDDAPANPYVSYEIRTSLRRLLDQLDPLGQQILVYRYLDGMTQQEVAELTGRSRKTVGKRLTVIDRLLAAEGGA